jgi:hypothetical protein
MPHAAGPPFHPKETDYGVLLLALAPPAFAPAFAPPGAPALAFEPPALPLAFFAPALALPLAPPDFALDGALPFGEGGLRAAFDSRDFTRFSSAVTRLDIASNCVRDGPSLVPHAASDRINRAIQSGDLTRSSWAALVAQRAGPRLTCLVGGR